MRSATAPFLSPRRVRRRVKTPSESPSKSQLASFSGSLTWLSLTGLRVIHLEGFSPSPNSSVQLPKFSSAETTPKTWKLFSSLIFCPSSRLVNSSFGWGSLALHSRLGAKSIFLGKSWLSSQFLPSLVSSHLRAHSSSTRMTMISSVNSLQASEASSLVQVSSWIRRHKSMPAGRGG